MGEDVMRAKFPMALVGAGLLLLVVGVIALSIALRPDKDRDTQAAFNLGGAFTLTGPGGQMVSEHSFPGKLSLIFFGYRFCPDVCPTGLQKIAATMEVLGARGTAVQPLLISVDPERDTPAALAEYVELFHPRMIGLTGKPEEIAAVAKTFRAYYRRAPGGDAESYSIDHSAYTYLADDTGRVLAVFGHDTPAQEMAAKIGSFLARLK